MEAMETGTGAKELGETTPVTGGPTATPTIYDVARLAGVATSTVSRALSNPGRVSFKTAEHIRKVAEQIGYRSGTLQRALPDVQTMRVAMIVADINNPVFHAMGSEVLSGRRSISATRCWSSRPRSLRRPSTRQSSEFYRQSTD
jgi:hypothetical protein